MTKQTRLMLPEELHRQAKVAAALQGVTLAAWIEAAIVEKLNRPAQKQQGNKKAA